MSNFVVISLILALLHYVLGASIPNNFSQYLSEQLNEQSCFYPPKTAFDIDLYGNPKDGFQYKACQVEINKSSMGKMCNEIMELTKIVCKDIGYMNSRLAFSANDMIIDIADIKKPFTEVDKQKVDRMCEQPFAYGHHEQFIFKSSQECKDSCGKEEYFYICTLYFAMEKVERKKFKEIKDFKDLDFYITHTKGRHAFPPVSSILGPKVPLNACINQTNVTAPICEAILGVSGNISDMALPEIDSAQFLTAVLNGQGCGNFSSLPALENVNVQPCMINCTSEKEAICKSLQYGMQFLKDLKLGESCTSSAGPKCPDNSECKDSICACRQGYTETNETCQPNLPASPNVAGLKLGDPCDDSVAEQKCPENAECTEKICNCKQGFINTNGTCQQTSTTAAPAIYALKLGDPCDDLVAERKCPDNAECTEKICECKQGFINTKGICQKATITSPPAKDSLKLGDPCDDSVAEQKCPENAECTEKICNCKQGFINTNGTCQQTSTTAAPAIYALKLGDPCDDSVAERKCPDNAECTEKICGCKQGFINTNGTCQQTSTTAAPAIYALKLGDPCDDSVAERKCPDNAECTEKICECKQGFINTNGTCQQTSTTAAPAIDTTDLTTDYDYEYDYTSDKDEGDNGSHDTDQEQGENKEPQKPEQKEKEKPISSGKKDTQMPLPAMDDEPKGGIGFMSYLLVLTVLVVAGYLLFHNKKKIIALVVEGKHGGHGGRRPNTSQYRKLTTNEVMPDLEKSATSTNYVY